MNKRIVLGAFSCLSAIAVSAQQPEIELDCDSLSQPDIILDEIVAFAPRVIMKQDRRVLIPNGEQIHMATGGVDLLRMMQLPRLTINQFTGKIDLQGGGTVRLYINGVEASETEINSIRTEDIVRIEYHDSPGNRYADADIVIDFITRRHDSGDYAAVDGFVAIGNGKWASIDHMSLQHHHGRSSWMFSGGYMGLGRDNWVRDYQENWLYPDHEESRREVGQPVHIGNSGIDAYLHYNLSDNDKYCFNVKFGLGWEHIPYKEEGDRHTLLYVNNSDIPISIHEHTSERSVTPTLDLYYQHSFGQGQQLIVDALATHIRSSYRHNYSEQSDGNIASYFNADVRGRKYSLLIDVIYEKKDEQGKFSGGVRHSQSYMDNHYDGTTMAEIIMKQAQMSVFCEYGRRWDRFGMRGGITALMMQYSQDKASYRHFSVQPSVHLSFDPSAGLMMRYDAEMRTMAPSLSEMSDVVQYVQTGMIRQGNPDLRHYSIVDQSLTMNYHRTHWEMNCVLGCHNEHDPVMETVHYDDGLFVRKYDNQSSFRRLKIEAMLSLRPWQDHVVLSVSPVLYDFVSKGNGFRHHHKIYRTLVDLNLSYHGWMLSYNTMMGPANTMYGEQWTEENNMNMLLIGYKRPRWSMQIGAFNLFMKEYWMKTVDLSALAYSISRAHCNKNTYFVVKLSLNVSHGRQKPVNNMMRTMDTDKDTGILQGSK